MSKIYSKESPEDVSEGMSKAYAARFSGVTDITSPSCKLYDANGEDKTSTLLTGSASASGNVITTPMITIPSPPSTEYLLEITASFDGATDVRKHIFRVAKKGKI